MMTPHLSICFSHGGIDKLFSFGGGIKGERVLGLFFVVVVFSPNFPFRIAQIRRQVAWTGAGRAATRVFVGFITHTPSQ